MTINPYEKWKAFWANEKQPHHAHKSPEWYDRYAKEILFYLDDAKTIVDTGCGSGEILVRIAKDFEKIIGIDYSPSMILEAKLKIQQKNLNNIDVYNADMLDIATIVTSPVDCIYNFSVIQYLNPQQLGTFIEKSKQLLTTKGKIVLMHIADPRYFDLYTSDFFKNTLPTSLPKLFIKHLRFKLYLLKQKLKNPGYKYDGDIGYWYSHQQIQDIASARGLSVEYTYSMYPPYGYRYNAILTPVKHD